MKIIPNKTCSVPMAPGQPTPTFAALLAFACQQPPQGGFDIAAQRRRLRVMDVCEATKEGEEIKLEDADYAAAQEALKLAHWGTAHRDIDSLYQAFGL